MPTLVTLAIVLISGMLLLVGLVGSKSTGAEPSAAPVVTEQAVTAEGVSSLSEAALRQMLADLKQAPPPQRKMGAMCYQMMAPPDQFDYVCPKCGEKTIYARSEEMPRSVVWKLSGNLADCRREAKKLPASPHVKIALDESEYCSNCTHDAKSPQLAIVVKYKDGRTHRTSSISDVDLRMIASFLGGKLDYVMYNDFTEPLKKQIPRLEQLLGLGQEGDEDASDD